ncbi:MAG: FAD-dependent oxidoreductase [Bacteroidales bacterium]|jgi:hypothetical protein|nr:FAD-dependent oxidoreductase [Bacteroidales bacterium]
MKRAKIKTLKQTAKNGLFSLVFENEDYSEFEKFILKFRDEADAVKDLNIILSYIEQMINGAGFLERYFRPEGKMKDNVCALPVVSGKLRLYCLRLSDSVLIAGGGGRKNTKTYDEDTNLNGYVISLQKLESLIQVEVKKGNIVIESGMIEGADDKIFEL